MGVACERVVAVAEAELGVREVPMGSNTGERVRAYQSRTHLAGTGWPWCAAFVEFVWESAGLADHPADPSTWIMWQRARERGEASGPSIGGAIIWPGVHTGLVVGIGAGIVHTIEGNSSDQVIRRVRATAGAEFVTPRDLDPPRGSVAFYLEDVGADVRVFGPWRLRSWAERKLRSLEPATRAQATIVEPGVGGYAIRVGRRTYGPWRDPAARENARAVLERRLGRRLRPYSVAEPAALAGGSAEALGRTV